MTRSVELIAEFQPYILDLPAAPESLYRQSCSNDEATINNWRGTWLGNMAANRAHFGTFAEKSLGQLRAKHRGQTVIIAGSGPSLVYNGEQLKSDHGAVVISCLHNFHFFEDRDIHVDYYVSLDAGPIVLTEVAEGGQHDPDWYWERTEGKTLFAFVASNPELFRKWRGKIYLFNCPAPDLDYMAEVDKIEQFNMFVSSGGNVLGACTYIAKGILGCSTTAFIGADFSFSYKNKFHGWDSSYDKIMGSCMRVVDVYGNSVKTWPSYHNFKSWFDWVASTIPGIYINCTEGGTFGAYREGNIVAVKQMELKVFLDMINMCEHLRDQCDSPGTAERKVLF